jgi:hypothetical protein
MGTFRAPLDVTGTVDTKTGPLVLLLRGLGLGILQRGELSNLNPLIPPDIVGLVKPQPIFTRSNNINSICLFDYQQINGNI